MALYDTISSEMREEISAYIHRKWEDASKSSLRDRVIREAKESKDAYDQIPTSKELWKNAVNLLLPFHLISVDQLEPRLVASIVAHEDVVQVEDPGQLDRDLKNDITKVDNVVLTDDLKIKEVVKRHIHDILLEGQIYVAPYWDFRRGKMREFMVGEDGKPMPAPGEGEEMPEGAISYGGRLMQEKVVKEKDKAQMDMLDLENIFIPDRVDDWEETPVVYEHYMTWGDYKGRVKQGTQGWVGHGEDAMVDLEAKLFTKRVEAGKLLRTEGEDREKGEPHVAAEQLKNELRCLQAHMTYDVDGDGIEEKIICTIEEQSGTILYIINNAELDPLNRKQIRKIVMLPRSGTGYGYNIYSKLKMITEGGSNTLNIVLNSCIIQMLPFFFYEESAGFQTQEIELFPGAGIPVSDVKRIAMNTFQPNAAAFKDVIEIFFRLWQYIITLPDYNVGREPTSEGSTATGVLALLQEAAISHDYQGATLHDQYGDLFRIIHDLCYLNMDPLREVEILGHEMSRRVLSNTYKVRLVSTSKSSNRHVERLEMTEAMTVGEKGVSMGVVTPDIPIRDYLALFPNINTEEWMNAPVSKVAGRMRSSMGLEGGEKEEEVDPFGDLVMQLLPMSPEALGQLMRTLEVGKAVRDDMTAITGGGVPDAVREEGGMLGEGGAL